MIVARLLTIGLIFVAVSLSETPLELIDPAFGYNVSAAGDWGCNDNTEKTVSDIISKDPEQVLGLGDYSYAHTPDCWLAIVEPIAEKMKITIGNHDDISVSLLNQYMSLFNLSKQYYSFSYQNAHFLVLSTEQINDSSQYGFAKGDLAKAASNPNIEWVIVYMHKPLYSSPGMHGGQRTMRMLYHPLFDKYGVDIVLYGHNHAYERSYPIKYNTANPSAPIITSTNNGSYSDPQGQIFATVGTAGESIYSYDNKSSYIVTQYEGYGFLDMNISRNALIAKFYSNSDGAVKDTFAITK